MMISYAGNREDVLLSRVFSDTTNGFYIDIGAGDPEDHSVTKHFYDLGWNGINVEPAADLYERLNEQRERDTNLNMGVAAEPGKLTFYKCPKEFWGFSTFSADQASIHRQAGIAIEEQAVELTTLKAICEEFSASEIDFLSVDVEGFEAQVLEGGDWQRWRPRLVVVEATRPTTSIPTHENWEKILLDADYVFVYFDGLNRFYLRREDSSLKTHFDVPVNVFDEFQPFEYVQQIKLLDDQLKDVHGQLVTEAALRGACEQTLNSVWSDHNQVNERLGQLAAQYEELHKLFQEIAGPLKAVEGLGPLGLGVARRIARMARRFPRLARFSRSAVRGGMAMRDRLRGTK